MKYLFIGFGGVFGATSRYLLSNWGNKRWQGKFPFATFLINISGSFALGLLYVLFSEWENNLPLLKYFVTTGFLGAFTTYSTFSLETINLIQEGKKLTALKYLSASLVIGILFAYLGIQLGKHL